MTKKKCKARARKSERPLKAGGRSKTAAVTGEGVEDAGVGAVAGTARRSPWAEPKTIVIPSLEDPLHEVLQFRNERGRIRKKLTVDKWIADKEYKGKKYELVAPLEHNTSSVSILNLHTRQQTLFAPLERLRPETQHKSSKHGMGLEKVASAKQAHSSARWLSEPVYGAYRQEEKNRQTRLIRQHHPSATRSSRSPRREHS